MHALRPPNRGILSPVPCWRSWVARAGLAAVGTVVLPLSLDDPGAIVTCGGRALVTADKGNGPQCVRSFEGVGAGPACPPADPAPMQRGGARRWISRTSRSSSVPGVGKERALGYGPESGGAEGLRQSPAQRRGAPACSIQEAGRSWAPAGGGGPGHGHHRGIPAWAESPRVWWG